MKTHLNLLPLPFRRRLVIRSELIRWGAACVMALVISAVWCLDAHRSSRLKQAQLDQLTTQAAPLRSLATDNICLAGQLNVSHRRHVLLQSLEGVHPPLQLLGIVSQSADNDQGSVQVRSFALTPRVAQQPKKSKATGRRNKATATSNVSEVSGQLSLQGVALNDGALTDFIDRLRRKSFFTSVDLRSSSTVQLSLGSARHYSVECRF